MKIVGLLSGGKDSIYNLLQCIAAGHEVVAVANIVPLNKEEMDSYMYQSVGHEAMSLIATCLGLPIFRQVTKGTAVCKDKTYRPLDEDEVEDMYTLLKKVKNSIQNVEGVAVGAIASDYQRTRVESVAERLELKCLAYLWRRDQQELLEEMIQCGVDAIIIKVAALGLRPDFHLGAHIREVKNNLVELNKKFGINICGEGGEYETLTLDCPLFNKKIKIIEHNNIVLTPDTIAPVGILSVKNAVLIAKRGVIEDPVISQMSRLNAIQKAVRSPIYYVEDCIVECPHDLVMLRKALDDYAMEDPKHALSFTKLESGKALQRSKSKMTTKIYSSSDQFSFDMANCQLNFSSGWCFIGHVTAPTIGEGLSILQKQLLRVDYTVQDLVQVELYVKDLSDYATLNSAYSEIMTKYLPPTRICVETCLPSEIGVLIIAVAQKCISKSQRVLINPSNPEKQVLHVQSISHWAPACLGPYSQCVRVGEVYYVAGQIPLVPGTMELFTESIYCQCILTLRHVMRILQAITSNLTFGNIMQATCYVTSDKLASMVKDMWLSITENVSATVTAVVVKALPKNAELEWHVIGCAFDEPDVLEETHIDNTYKVYLKRCLYLEYPTSSVLCKVHQIKKKKAKTQSESTTNIDPLDDLVQIVKNCLQFLKADLPYGSVPLCLLKIYYDLDDDLIANVINEVTKSSEYSKVIISGIPVLALEEHGVCLTIVGICH